MGKDYPWVDLLRMVERPKCAVFFRTIEEIESFYRNCERQLAEYIGFWELADMVDRWERNHDVGFTFLTGDEPESMTWCDRDWFSDEGYELIEFYDLANPVEIAESEMSVDVLLS